MENCLTFIFINTNRATYSCYALIRHKMISDPSILDKKKTV